MTSNWLTVLITVIGGGYLVGVAALIVAIAGRKKTKADALAVIEAAAAAQVIRMESEAERWRNECIFLRSEIDDLRSRVDENDVCQTTLNGKIATLESEKAKLIDKVENLMRRIEDLEAENKCLREKRANVPA